MRIASEIFTSVSSAGRPACSTGVHHTEFLSHLRDFVLQVVGDELAVAPSLSNSGPTVVHVVQCAVVALDGDEVRHVLAGTPTIPGVFFQSGA